MRMLLKLLVCAVVATAVAILTLPSSREVGRVTMASNALQAPGATARPTRIVLVVARPTAIARPTTGPSASGSPERTTGAVKRPTAAQATPRPTLQPTPKPTPKPTPEPTPKPTVKPTSAPAQGREEVKAQIRQGWGGNDDDAIAVADCESGLNPKAASPHEINLGLWQMRKDTWKSYGGPGDDPRDSSALVQTQVAYRLFSSQGWGPWGGCAS